MAEHDKNSEKGRPDIEYVDGAAVAARILRKYPREQRERLMVAIAAESPELATKVQERMYNFEELKELSSQGTQTLVREIPHADLVAAVAGASEEVKEKLLSGMSDRKREMVIEDTSSAQHNLKTAQVKEAQWRMLEKLDELREKGAVRTESKKGVWV